MGEIIEKDFGKEDREHARRLSRLLGLLADQEADMLANPGVYLKMAGDKIAELMMFQHELYAAIQRPFPMKYEPSNFETIETRIVDKAEYDRLKKVEAIIRSKGWPS